MMQSVILMLLQLLPCERDDTVTELLAISYLHKRELKINVKYIFKMGNKWRSLKYVRTLRVVKLAFRYYKKEKLDRRRHTIL